MLKIKISQDGMVASSSSLFDYVHSYVILNYNYKKGPTKIFHCKNFKESLTESLYVNVHNKKYKLKVWLKKK